jgi:peroxiredoxin
MIASACLAVLAGCGTGKEAGPEASAEAPGFTLANYDGRQISLSDYGGKIVVLEWLNFECPFVKYHYETKTTMADLAEKYKDMNVAWLAINSTKHATRDQDREFAEKHKLPYPILDDRSGKTGRAYGAVTTPHMFVIDTGGSVVYNGAIDNAPRGKVDGGGEPVNYVDRALSELAAGKTVTTGRTKPYGCTVKYAQ